MDGSRSGNRLHTSAELRMSKAISRTCDQEPKIEKCSNRLKVIYLFSTVGKYVSIGPTMRKFSSKMRHLAIYAGNYLGSFLFNRMYQNQNSDS